MIVVLVVGICPLLRPDRRDAPLTAEGTIAFGVVAMDARHITSAIAWMFGTLCRPPGTGGAGNQGPDR
jgi:hypothetical protein